MGTGADGIFAQSIGGGGGIVGVAGSSIAPLTGSAGGTGSAGNINVTENGTIYTQGSNASGIFAQSAGGSGSGGNVTVTVNGSIYVTSPSAVGVLGESSGTSGGGDVSVTLAANGVIVGGGAGTIATQSEATNPGNYHDDIAERIGLSSPDGGAIPSGTSGAAVEFVGGMNNALVNNGVITTLTGTNGYAVVSDSGNTAITNNGVMVGSVSLAPGTNSLTNSQTGVFITGPTINLGAGNTFTNAGLVAPGGIGTVGTTNVTGNFVQTSTGELAADVNLANGTYDQINVSGSATVAGTLNLTMLNINLATPGTHNYNVVTAGGTVNQSGLTIVAPTSVVSTYSLVSGPNGALTLQQIVNFQPAQLTGNTASFGNFINKLQGGGSSKELAGMIAQIFAADSPAQLSQLYNELTPSTYGAMEDATLLGVLNFSQQMLTCRSPETDYASLSRGRCVWGNLGSAQLTQVETSNAVGFSENGSGVSYGFQNVVSKDQRTLFGGAFAFGDDNLYANTASMWGSRFTAGLLLKREMNNGVTYSADVTGGSGNYQTRRTIQFPSPTVSTSSGAGGFGSFDTPPVVTNGGAYVSYFNASIRADKYIPLADGFAFTPYLALNETRTSLSPTKETGAGALNIDTVYQGDSFMTLQPGFELGGTFTSKNWQMRPHIDFYATHFIGNNQTSLPALLQGQPVWLGPLVFNNTIDRTLWNVSPTVDFGGSRGFSMRVGGNYQFSNNMHAGTLWLNFSQKVGPTPQTP
jgi:hypothetical protein